MNQIDYITKQECCGCMACVSSCPYDAIDIKIDEEGFYGPVINREKCKNCGKCQKTCPLNSTPVRGLAAPTHCYACYIKDYEKRMKSSSGGIFSILAEQVLSENGVICGAVVDQDCVVRHVLADKTRMDLVQKMRGSKYVQSLCDDKVYKQIKALLSEGRTVLFTGTPCQVAGINAFITGANRERLITVDFVCHGVPSPGLFKMYLEEQFGRDLSNIASISFRDKAHGWHSVKLKVEDKNGQVLLNERIGENPFLKSFQQIASLRKACHACHYACKDRGSDLTIGDFWGIEKFDSRLNDNLGTSLLLCNTEKGRQLFSRLGDVFQICQEVSSDLAIANQSNLRRPTKINPLRSAVFHYYSLIKQLAENGNSNAKFSISNELSRLFIPVGILNFYDADNFGAVLVPYALSKTINKLGYKAEVINFKYHKDTISDEKFDKFRNDFLPLSPQGSDYEFLNSVLHRYQTVITGSDQVFRMRDTNKYMLNWVFGRKKILSYAASFGTSEYSGSIEAEEAKKLLDRFDMISVREKEGVDICRNEFGKTALQILDPVLMLNAEEYGKIIESEDIKPLAYDYVGCIFLGETRKAILKDPNVIPKIKKKYKLVNVVRYGNGVLRSIPEYLSLIKNAKYILTNSFHGLVLSIVFKKPFITVVNLDPSRQLSLLKMLNIDRDRLVDNLDGITLGAMEKPIDYQQVDLLLNELRRYNNNFLEQALSLKITEKPPVSYTVKYAAKVKEKIIVLYTTYSGNERVHRIKGVNHSFKKSYIDGSFMIDDIAVDSFFGQQLNIFLSYIRKKTPKKALAVLKEMKDNNKKYSDIIEELLKLFKN